MLSRRRRFPLRQRSLKRPPEPTGKTPAGGKPSMSELPKVSRRLLNTRSMAIQRPGGDERGDERDDERDDERRGETQSFPDCHTERQACEARRGVSISCEGPAT